MLGVLNGLQRSDREERKRFQSSVSVSWKSSEQSQVNYVVGKKSYMACISAQLNQTSVPIEGNGKYQKASTVMMSQENALK